MRQRFQTDVARNRVQGLFLVERAKARLQAEVSEAVPGLPGSVPYLDPD
jgi:hypothetical protein